MAKRHINKAAKDTLAGGQAKDAAGYIALRRSATEVIKYAVWTKVASITALCLVGVVAVAYLGSFIYDRYGAFTVSVNKYDMVEQGLSLSETDMFLSPTARLTAEGIKEITNMSGDTLPTDIDSQNGSHNGTDYVAYTFHVKNVGKDTVSYDYDILLTDVTQNIDSAIRVRVYQNGKPTTYARTKADGSGPERGTVEFATAGSACIERRHDFKTNDVDKYTVIFWLEGDDPECVDAIIGGKMKMEMKLKIVESA